MSNKNPSCPVCGAVLKIDEKEGMMSCDFCGAKLPMGYHFTHRSIDDAKIKEAEVQKDIRYKELDYAEKQSRRRFTKWIMIVLLCVIGVLAASVFLLRTRSQRMEEDYQKQLAEANAQEHTIEVSPEMEVSTATVQAIVKKAGELVTYKYLFTDIGDYNKDKKLFKKWSIPFTKDKSIYSYSGTINIGILTDDISVNVDSKNKIIHITVPKARILSNKIDSDSFKVYSVKNSIFTSTDLSEYQKMISSLEEIQKEKLEANSDIFIQAQEYAGELLKNLLTVYSEEANYSISLSYM